MTAARKELEKSRTCFSQRPTVYGTVSWRLEPVRVQASKVFIGNELRSKTFHVKSVSISYLPPTCHYNALRFVASHQNTSQRAKSSLPPIRQAPQVGA